MNKRLVLLSAALLLLAGCVSGGEPNKPEPAPKGKSVETAFTLDEMIEEMKDYTGGQISQEEYYVTGKIATGSTYNANYGSWTMYGEGHEKESEKPFQFYSCQMDESITANYRDDGCLDGATIVVKGYVQLYVKEGEAPVFEICYLSASKSPTGEAVSPVILSVEGGHEFVPPQPTAMAIGEDFELVKDNTKQLTVAWTPSNAAPQQVTWSSSDNTKATVDQNGLVTGVAAGPATITATAGALSASVTVTVIELSNTLVISKDNSGVGTTTLTAAKQVTYRVLSGNVVLEWSAGCFDYGNYDEVGIAKTSGYVKVVSIPTGKKISTLKIDLFQYINISVYAAASKTGDAVTPTDGGESGKNKSEIREYAINGAAFYIDNSSNYAQAFYSMEIVLVDAE